MCACRWGVQPSLSHHISPDLGVVCEDRPPVPGPRGRAVSSCGPQSEALSRLGSRLSSGHCVGKDSFSWPGSTPAAQDAPVRLQCSWIPVSGSPRKRPLLSWG